MANDADNVVVAANGFVATAPVGSTLPTDATTALDAAFTELGYINEDGVSFAPDVTIDDLPAWQSLSPIRTLLTNYIIEVSFGLMEWIEDNLKLAFGGGVFTDNGDGTWDYLLPLPGERAPFAMVIEGQDGANRYRIVLDRVELSDTGEVTFQKGDASQFPVTVRALAGAGGRPGAIYGSVPVAP